MSVSVKAQGKERGRKERWDESGDTDRQWLDKTESPGQNRSGQHKQRREGKRRRGKGSREKEEDTAKRNLSVEELQVTFGLGNMTQLGERSLLKEQLEHVLTVGEQYGGLMQLSAHVIITDIASTE